MHATPSLFVVALPRSLSTVIYEQAAAALQLRCPLWTTAGEILNGDRVVLAGSEEGSLKFTPPERSADFTRLKHFLDDVVHPTGVAYKDVVQPFAVSQWLRDKSLPVLYVRRPLADVAWSFERAGWRYPVAAAPELGSERERLLAGLARAARALASLERAVVLDFDAALDDEGALHEALRRLYPQARLQPVRYRDAAFVDYARDVRERRRDARWQALDAALRAIDERATSD